MDSIIQALLQEQQNLATENPYLNAAKAMNGAGMVASNDPRQNAISQSIVAALSGLSSGYGKGQVKREQKELGAKVAGALAGPQEQVGPALAEVSPEMGTIYELQAAADRRKQAELSAKYKMDLEKSKTLADYKDQQGRGRIELKHGLDLERDAKKGGKGGSDTGFKSLQSLRKEFQTLPEVQAFVTSDIGYGSLKEAIKDPAATSDLELIRGAIQAIEPGMAVREGEAAAVETSSDIPSQWKGSIRKAMTGESALPEHVREGILRIAERRYNEYANKFNTARTFYQKQATNSKLDPEGVTYLPAVESQKAPAPVGGGAAQTYNEQDLSTAGYSSEEIQAMRNQGLIK